ncbi:MAG TPA: cytochrome c maturation protein CcmE [Methylophilaceae bacterium]|nr:cytochrome c maturation protein CcmE [Methylophilaceae bacterium]
MKSRHKRMAIIVAGVILLAVAATLLLQSFQSNLVFFFSPTEVAEGKAPKEGNFRIGGLVEMGSIQRNGTQVKFRVTDTAKTMDVVYTGILPDLFKEGKGVVAQGKQGEDGIFIADQVLAKHDENYMPPEAADALEKAKANATMVNGEAQ